MVLFRIANMAFVVLRGVTLDCRGVGRDGNDKEEQVPHEAGVTSATFTYVKNPKQNEQSGWEDANIQAMKNTKGNPKSSFVNVVSAEKKNPKINFRVLFNKEHVENSDFVLPVESVEIAHNRFANSLVIKDDDDVYYFKFTSTTELAKDVVTKVPVWVKIHKVPVVAYSEDGLSLIASQIGKPVLLDAFTSAMCNEPWGVSGSSVMDSAMCDFKDCVNNINVFDINSFGLHFTWNQKSKGRDGVLKKLDCIMGNIDFVDVYPSAYAIFQPYRISDHSSRVLKIPSLSASKPKPFKFFNFGNLHKRVIRLRNELGEVQKALDRNPTNYELRDEEVVYVQAFNNAKLDEERFLRQKAKIEWLEVGDSNSAYFHKSIKIQNQRSRIDVITKFNNAEVTGNHVPNVFVSHYMDFLGSRMMCDELDSDYLFQNKVSDMANENMIKPVTNEEIKRAMFGIGDDKASGPDGFTSTFFKKGWDVVGQDVCNAVRDFFVNGKLLKEINHTFLALVLKTTTSQ
nr:hypothetical protein [Tanacetum cinerariifolium]